ncbi:MAG: hypothetical protein ABGZ35_23340, partial [Planctomycetaceae bacterium]
TRLQLIDRLNQLSGDNQLPPTVKEEVLFYLACLLIESGDTAPAIDLLMQSRAIAPRSQFYAIREFYLQQVNQ